MAAAHHHPIFARLYSALAPGAEKLGPADHRQEALAGLEGRVIEVGAGNGLNFGHYPPEVTEVLAVEPEPYLRHKAHVAANAAPVPVMVVDGAADALPADDGSFDVVVASLVLCSVPDPDAALAEMRRVVRPGGQLRFYEHIRSDDPGRARLQDRVDHVWPLLIGGCHTGRDTVGAIEKAGFVISAQRRFLFQPCALTGPVAPHVIGTAQRP